MFDQEFYPTPYEVAVKMAEGIEIDARTHVLEPSAGSGNLLDFLKHKTKNLYAIERSPELSGILKSKWYRILHDDFLTYSDALAFDVVFMNPPFSNADEHFLKAWETVADGGTVVCLMNWETVSNPYSAKRRLMADIVEKHGTSENLGDCFRYADRKTGIEIGMVKVTKPGKASYEFGEFQEEEIEFSDLTSNELASRDAVDTICRQYAVVKELYAQGYALIEKAQRIGNQIISHRTEKYGDVSANHNFKPFEIASKARDGRDAVNETVSQLKIGVWENIARELKLEKYMTDKVRQDFRKKMMEQGAMAVNPENIRLFVQAVLTNAGTFLEDCVVEVFDQFTKYHEGNRVHVEWWKTNSSWKVKKRVILPYWTEVNWNNRFSSYNAKTDDVDRAMCFLTGKNFNSVVRIIDALKDSVPGEKCESEFFFVRWYLKGTLHLEFKDAKLLEAFNIRVALKRNWLPPEERRKYETALSVRTGS